MPGMKILFISAFTISMFQLLFFVMACNAEGESNYFKIHDEVRISSVAMNCNYQLEDYAKYGYNFKYPKLIITDDRNPLIAFIDEKSEQLIFADVADNDVKIVQSYPSIDNSFWNKWPIIFIRENKIYLASFPERRDRVKIYLFDRDTKRLYLQTDRLFNISEHCSLSSIYPYQENYMLAGNCSFFCLRYLPYIFGNLPTFVHNASFLLNENKILERQSTEEEGCFSAYNSEYAVSKSGIIYSAWMRDTHTVKPKRDEMIFYSINRDGTKWGKPIKLYLVKDTDTWRQLNNLSLASSTNSAFLLWQDFGKGIYFAEIRDGNKHDVVEISDMKKTTDVTQEPLEFASTIKVASDNVGNAYALWTMNSGHNYQLFFKARINGKWTKLLKVSSGCGFLKLPDMKIDKKGKVHITYIRSMQLDEPRDKFGCYYIKLVKS